MCLSPGHMMAVGMIEVLFSEPVVITACEFLEQNAASLCPAVKLVGATSPPSFALEVFIQCEGETRFRRLCMPYLYSHSSSNVLEVEALVTNHLVVRGSYRSLSMVIYGNTAEDLGQYNIEVDLDSSLIDTVCSIEGNLEDLPPAFRSTKLTNKELVSPLNLLNRAAVALDIPLELRQFLQLVLKILGSKNLGEAVDKALNSLLSVASSYQTIDLSRLRIDGSKHGGDTHHVLADAVKELLDIDKMLQNLSGNLFNESSAESLFLESEARMPTSKELLDTLEEHFDFCGSAGNVGFQHLSQNMNTILWLSVARLLCSSRESCSYFVNYGGMKQLRHVFTHCRHDSTTLTLLLLEAIEQATQHSIGCEGFLGWLPREKELVPSGISDGYNQLLKLLLKNQRHDVASLATYILHRLRFYEIACRYEQSDNNFVTFQFSVLSILGGLSAVGRVTKFSMDMLTSINVQLKTLLKLIKLSGPIDDPSPMAAASRSFLLVDGGVLTYKATSGLINLSNCCFSNADIDSNLLSLLKERGFLPLSAALLSSPILRAETGRTVDLFVDIVLHIEAIFLSLLFCRSGLAFLLNEPDVFSTVMHTLSDSDDFHREDSISLRYATVLISKGFFCPPKEVGVIAQMHARALISVDSLCELTPNTEEFLWVLWDLCRLSRSECGRQALLTLVNFPEALAVLMNALHCGVEFDPISLNNGLSPLHLAIFHSAAEIFEVIVTDSTSTSLTSWIDHAKELHRTLHASSPGSNMKDAPARLLEWIDAGVVYHKNGAVGLLQYAAVLASGGDAHMVSNSVLASDMMDADNVTGDSFCSSDGNVVDTLIGKRITEKDFTGVILRDSSVAQLTTAFRILSFISDDQDVKEQHRNTKLMNTLLQLHREVSPKLAACAADLTHSCPEFSLGYGSVCHLLASAIAYWPVYSWTPGLFHFLLDGLHATSLLVMGPKEICSLFCLLNDLLPEENIWLWKLGRPTFSYLRALAVGTLLGPLKEKQVNWYLRPGPPEKLIAQLSPQLTNLGEIILHCCVSMSIVVQDILRIFVVRIACLNIDNASALLKPLLSWISHRLSDPSVLFDVDAYKVHQLLNFLCILLEHPNAKPLLLKEGGIQMLTKVLDMCMEAANSVVKHSPETLNIEKYGSSLLSCCIPIFKSISLICDGQTSVQHPSPHDRLNLESASAIRYFFGVKNENATDGFIEESLKHIESLKNLIGSETSNEAVQLEYGPPSTNSPTPSTTSIGIPPMKFGRTSLSSPGLSTRPPPLPPTPPPYSGNASTLSSLKNPTSQSPQYFQTVGSSELQQISVAPKVDSGFVNPASSRSMLSSYPQPPLGQSLLYRPGSIHANLYGNNLVQQHGDNLPNFLQNLPISQASVDSIPILSQLQALQTPQIPRPPPQHLRPPVPISSQLDQGPPPLSKSSSQVQQQTSQLLQPLQAAPSNMRYQTPQQEHLPHISQQPQTDRSQLLQQPEERTSQLQDPAMSLQEYFKSPEAIQSLLSDRDKLCQLLEQHPKLMQMLQVSLLAFS
ncbi:hypothetical protein F511_36386 [Dorcoceras hygrometricum]|uniref:Virilizer N-terminal domain-containing protein n=1 Tax=Dorcoceras hygrometricum TaxID=472368 RepID=A0A2Z7BEW6_9LAMI|nr:hypothetical protein F511_36386 [Dorcoceras hygrometricum]